MLRDLQITDLALIEDLALEFGPGLNIITGENCDDSRHCAGRRSIDAYDVGMSVRRAQEMSIRLTGNVEILLKDSFSAQQIVVFLALNRLPHSEFSHVYLSV